MLFYKIAMSLTEWSICIVLNPRITILWWIWKFKFFTKERSMKIVSGSIALIKSDNLLSEYTSDKLRGFVYSMILPCKNKPRQTNSNREFSMECFKIRDSKSCFKCVDSNLLFITVYISGKVLSCKSHWEQSLSRRMIKRNIQIK